MPKSIVEIDEEMRDTPGRLRAAELLNSVGMIFLKGPPSTELSRLVVAETWFGLRKVIGDELDQKDEADRRAGEAERLLTRYRDGERKQQSWLDEAKEAEGHSRNIPFDDVWESVRKERDRLKAALEILRDNPAAVPWVRALAGRALDGTQKPSD